jgi:hypothetical protein
VAEPISVQVFRGGILTVLEEVFERVHGYVLDEGTSLFETLATISAEEASRRVSPVGACLAAQVNHVRFYMDVLAEGVASGTTQKVDWAGSWAISSVTDHEWKTLIDRLRASYVETRGFIQSFENWDMQFVGGAFALVAHCAYHLGEIRQGLGVLLG